MTLVEWLLGLSMVGWLWLVARKRNKKLVHDRYIKDLEGENFRLRTVVAQLAIDRRQAQNTYSRR